VQTLRPGSAVAVGFSSGDVRVSAVGTVAYVDGPSVWAFGHPFEGLGRRALFLQDAYIYTVIQNPLGIQDFGAITYKLASADGHIEGAVTSDKADAIAGKVGPRPRSIPLHIEARNRAGQTVVQDTLLADERQLGYGAGISFVAPLGLTQAIDRLMRDFGDQTLRTCLRIRVRELREPMGFCNLYFSVDDAVDDVGEAGARLNELLEHAREHELKTLSLDLSTPPGTPVTLPQVARA
jgi:hypothetical protein